MQAAVPLQEPGWQGKVEKWKLQSVSVLFRPKTCTVLGRLALEHIKGLDLSTEFQPFLCILTIMTTTRQCV